MNTKGCVQRKKGFIRFQHAALFSLSLVSCLLLLSRERRLTRTKAEKAHFFNKYNDYSDVCVTCEQYGDLACCQRKGCHNVYCIECEGFGDLGEVPKTGWLGPCCRGQARKRPAGSGSAPQAGRARKKKK